MMTGNRGLYSFMILFGFMSGGACTTDKLDSPKKTETQTSSDQKSSTPDERSTPTGGEGADVPSHIAGSYLTCALRKEATAADLNQEYGCFLSDPATDRKLDQDPRLTWDSSAATGFDFLPPYSDYTLALYNTLLVVRGSSKADIDAKILNTDIIASYDFKSVVVKRLYNVLRPAYEVQDFEAPVVRDQAIEEDRDAPPVDPF